MDKRFLILFFPNFTYFHINILICLCTAELLQEKLTHLIETTGLNGNLLDKVRT